MALSVILNIFYTFFSFSVGSMYAVLLKEMSVMYPGDKGEKVRLT